MNAQNMIPADPVTASATALPRQAVERGRRMFAPTASVRAEPRARRPVIACVDGTVAADAVVRHACMLADALGEPLVILHTMDPLSSAGPADPIDWAIEQHEARARLEMLAKGPGKARCGTEVILRQGRAPEGAARLLTEPYAVPADIGGEPPHVGRGGWSWYTGAAAWAWRLGVESILGIRLHDGALAIEPCLPPEWQGCTALIKQLGGSIRIVMERTTSPDAPACTILVDGKTRTGDIAFPTDGSERLVRLVLGRAAPSPAPDTGCKPPSQVERTA